MSLGASASFSAGISVQEASSIGARSGTDYGAAYLDIALANSKKFDMLVEDVRASTYTQRTHDDVLAAIMAKAPPGPGTKKAGDYTVSLVPEGSQYESLRRGMWTVNWLAPKAGSASTFAVLLQQLYDAHRWPALLMAANAVKAELDAQRVISTGLQRKPAVIDTGLAPKPATLPLLRGLINLVSPAAAKKEEPVHTTVAPEGWKAGRTVLPTPAAAPAKQSSSMPIILAIAGVSLGIGVWAATRK